MSAADQIPGVRKRLQRDLGREPTLTEVAEVIGVTRERVRQIYVQMGLDTTAGERALYAPSRHAKAVERARIEAKRRKAEARERAIVRLAKAESHLTQAQIAERVGATQRQVSDVMIRAGITRRYMFTAEEDEVVMNMGLSVSEAARLLNRAPTAIVYRRRALLSGADPYTEDPDLATKIVESFRRHRTAAAVAEEVGAPYISVLRTIKREFGKRTISECREAMS